MPTQLKLQIPNPHSNGDVLGMQHWMVHPHGLGTRMSCGNPKHHNSASHTNISTFPATSTRWTSEREEVPGRGTRPIPSHPVPPAAIQRRLRVRPGFPRHGTASGALPAGPAGAGAGGLIPLLGPSGAAPPLHARVRERRLRPGRPCQQHVRVSPGGLLPAHGRPARQRPVPPLRRQRPPAPPQRLPAHRLPQPGGEHLVAEPVHGLWHPAPQLRQHHPAPG